MAQSGPAAQASHLSRTPQITKYEVIEAIGHGGMATVYRAHDPRLSRDVAIKVIHRHLRDSAEIAHRFFVEAKAVAKLRHENIVEVYDVSAPDEEEQYLVYELVRGRSLRKVLEAHGAFPPEVAVKITLELLAALAHAHSVGVIHRDIKPENVIVEHVPEREPGERVKIKLTDFGIAKLLDSQGMTSTGQVLGSPAHMAPEQIEGGDVDARADVFGVGVLLYECMVGHLPFEGSNPAQVLRRVLEGIYPSAENERPTVGKTWSRLVDRALSRTVEGRFQDAAQMRDALQEELARLSAPAGRGDIEAWFADPEAYRAEHERELITRLCDLGKEARARGDALGAASDYNRALAYAPHDKALLRIVSTMHRSEVRRRALRRGAPVVLGAILCAALAFFATRAFRTNVAPEPPPRTTVETKPVDEPPPEVIEPDRPAVPPPRTQVPVAVSIKVPAPRVPAGAPAAQKPAVTRDIVFASLRPQFGVKVSVDSEKPIDAEVGGHVTLDGQRHVLTFTCAQDSCEPQESVIPAGEDAPPLRIALVIKPASLFVQGDPRASYTIQEQPSVPLRAGTRTQVPMNGAKTTVHVVELPSNRVEAVTLVAGKQVEVLFSPAGENP